MSPPMKSDIESNFDQLQPSSDQGQRNLQPILVGGCINSQQFETIAEIYDQIRSWNSEFDYNYQLNDAELAERFDNDLKVVMSNINNISNSIPELNIERNNMQDLSKQQSCMKGLESLYNLC